MQIVFVHMAAPQGLICYILSNICINDRVKGFTGLSFKENLVVTAYSRKTFHLLHDHSVMGLFLDILWLWPLQLLVITLKKRCSCTIKFFPKSQISCTFLLEACQYFRVFSPTVQTDQLRWIGNAKLLAVTCLNEFLGPWLLPQNLSLLVCTFAWSVTSHEVTLAAEEKGMNDDMCSLFSTVSKCNRCAKIIL